MTPDVSLTTAGGDLTAALRERLVALTVTDAAGVESDTLELTLEDRAPHLALPAPGTRLELALGYQPQLTAMGAWRVTEVSAAGWPARLSVRATAADLTAGLKTPRERSWPAGTTLGALVATLAGEHGYQPVVAAALAGVALPHIDQTESDLHLLTRLARDYDAVAKPAGGRLVCVPKGQAKTASGAGLPPVTLRAADLADYACEWSERDRYGAVTTHWHDLNAGLRQAVTVGSGTPVYSLRGSYVHQAAATRAAAACLAAWQRGTGRLTLACAGNPALAAEGRLTVTDVHPDVDGAWTLTRVTHTLDAGGYRCTLEAEAPAVGAA